MNLYDLSLAAKFQELSTSVIGVWAIKH